MSGFRELLETSDKIAREELGNYYIISASRMDNYLWCIESGAEKIKTLADEHKKLRDSLMDDAKVMSEFIMSANEMEASMLMDQAEAVARRYAKGGDSK